MAIIGIDLGTTNSVVAFTDKNGITQTIAGRDGGRIVPSVIYFPENADIVVGERARSMSVIEPSRVASLFKRGMGSPTFLADGSEFIVDAKAWRPEELSSLVLKKLKLMAEEFLGESVTDAVVTVPAYFGDPERAATRDAARIAGLNPIKILNEPTAAAIAHGFDSEASGKNLLVFDLGGGTFDVTVMRISNENEMEVLATGGDRRLGGADFDIVIVSLMIKFAKTSAGVDLQSEPWMKQDALEKAEEMKKELSVAEISTRSLSTGGRPLAFTLSRIELEAALESFLTDVSDTVELTLRDSGLTAADIDVALMVGGSSRIPAFQNVLSQVLGKQPIFTKNLDEDVARGAAILATKLSGTADARSELAQLTIPQDIASHGLGITALEVKPDGSRIRYNSVLIPAGTQIPAEREEIYVTADPDQSSISIELNEGSEEDLTFVRNLGKGSAEFGRPVRQGYPIRVIIQYTADQVVQLRALDGETGVVLGEMKVQREGALSEEDKLAALTAIGKLGVE